MEQGTIKFELMVLLYLVCNYGKYATLKATKRRMLCEKEEEFMLIDFFDGKNLTDGG